MWMLILNICSHRDNLFFVSGCAQSQAVENACNHVRTCHFPAKLSYGTFFSWLFTVHIKSKSKKVSSLSLKSVPICHFPHVQQLPSREQWWRAASQSEEKQEQLKQWQHQEGWGQESLELRGGPDWDPATAQNPHQTSSHQVRIA